MLLTALWFVRRRRQETEDVTGRWEALESETDDDQQTRDATERMRRHVPEQTIVVEEQHAEQLRPAPPSAESRPRAAAAAPRPQRPAAPADETLSSQTVINLDQADAVAEADFHIAYGLYDQAAELVQKALEAAPDRRDLKLKLLEVYFMWGNKDSFLKAAQALRADIGQARRSRLEQGRHHGPPDLPRRALVHGSDDGRQVASTSISKPAIRRSISRSTMRRPTWRRRRAAVST